jgi:hypothetical protein
LPVRSLHSLGNGHQLLLIHQDVRRWFRWHCDSHLLGHGVYSIPPGV